MTTTPHDALKQSKPLCLTRDAPDGQIEFNTAVQDLLNELDVKGHSRLLQANLRVLLVNLIRLARYRPSGFISYSRDNNWWAQQQSLHLNPFRCSRKMVELIDAMVSQGYLSNLQGYNNRNKAGGDNRFNVWARISLTSQGIDFIKDYNILNVLTPRCDNVSSIYLKKEMLLGTEKRNLLIENKKFPKDVKESEKILGRYNSFISQTVIGISRQVSGLYLDETHVYRVFNRGDYACGGRLYGAWWQSIKKELRSLITLNNEPTVELDFKGQHINLLYALRGIPLPTGDVYQIESLERDVVKKTCLTMVNAKSVEDAFKALRDQFKGKKPEDDQDDEEAYEDGTFLDMTPCIDKYMNNLDQFKSSLVQPIIAKHAAIAGDMFADKGISLMNLDSRICLHVLDTMTNLGIPCLSVHDSFIINKQYINELTSAMNNGYAHVGLQGYCPSIETKDVHSI